MSNQSGAGRWGVVAPLDRSPLGIVSAAMLFPVEVDGLAVIMIEPIGSPICDAPCDVVPIAGAARLSAQIVIQRPVVGVIVPTAAIRHDAGGATSVRTPTGEVAVSVVTSVDGLAIVDGIRDGTEVVLPEEPVD